MYKNAFLFLGAGAHRYVSSYPWPPSSTLFMYNIFGRGLGVLAGFPIWEIFQSGLSFIL